MSELYSYDKYKGYHLFVEVVELDEEDDEVGYGCMYYGSAQLNGTTMFHSKSLISGDTAELFLKEKIDKEIGDD